MNAPSFTGATRFDAACEASFLDVPASPGIALFETDAGVPVSILATSDLRQLARTRLDPALARGSTKSLVGAATAVRTIQAESEAARRLLWLLHAHAALPRLADEGAKTPPCWFLRLDARDEYPKAVPLAPRDLASLPDLRGVYGPYPTRKGAARAGEAVTDALDLCRHHHLLVLEPHASACAYKDMGRCPAPCDGSESMASYRARVERGQRWLADPLTHRAEALAAMKDAASALDYERAGAHKTLLARTAPLDGTVAREVHGAMWCVIASSDPQDRVCVIACSGTGARWLSGGAPPDDVPSLLGASVPDPGEPPLTPLRADVLGWLGELACLPDDLNTGRRACAVVALPSDAAQLEAAARGVVVRASSKPAIE